VKVGEEAERYRYHLRLSPFAKQTLIDVQRELFAEDNSSIFVISIDTSADSPKLVKIRKRYDYEEEVSYFGGLRINQKQIISTILYHFMPFSSCNREISEVIQSNTIISDDSLKMHNNIKILVSGERGKGKSFIGLALKKILDSYFSVSCKLFDDFNPKDRSKYINTWVNRSLCCNSCNSCHQRV